MDPTPTRISRRDLIRTASLATAAAALHPQLLSAEENRPTTAADLWAQYQKSPDTHPNLPNCSYAGYARSEKPLPQPKVVANVKDAGAKADGKSDDTAAFAKAISQASTAGGGAVLI